MPGSLYTAITDVYDIFLLVCKLFWGGGVFMFINPDLQQALVRQMENRIKIFSLCWSKTFEKRPQGFILQHPLQLGWTWDLSPSEQRWWPTWRQSPWEPPLCPLWCSFLSGWLGGRPPGDLRSYLRWRPPPHWHRASLLVHDLVLC